MAQDEIERLGRDSSDAQTKAAISACIANEMRAGIGQQEAVAICMGMARDKGAPVPATGGN